VIHIVHHIAVIGNYPAFQIVVHLGYRCDDGKELGELRGDIGAIRYRCMTSSYFRKHRSFLLEKNEAFSQQGINSKIPFLYRGWDLSIYKTGCRASGLHALK
jgi:hypothetical protein